MKKIYFYTILIIVLLLPILPQVYSQTKTYPYKINDYTREGNCRDKGDVEGYVSGLEQWCIQIGSKRVVDGKCPNNFLPIGLPPERQVERWCIPGETAEPGKQINLECPSESQKRIKPDNSFDCIVNPISVTRDPETNKITAVQCPGNAKSAKEGDIFVCLVDPVKKLVEAPSQTPGISGSVRPYKLIIPIPCQPLFGGACPTVETPAGYIARLYQFGLMIAGLAAFGAIVFGSIQYIASAGNTSLQGDAKDRIYQAILGLILLLGAFLVLYTINPDLVSLRNPMAEFINIEKIIQEGGGVPDGEQDAGTGEIINPEAKNACKLGVTVKTDVSGGPTPGNKSYWRCLRCIDGYYLDSSFNPLNPLFRYPVCKPEETRSEIPVSGGGRILE